jgi:hypothetical protein
VPFVTLNSAPAAKSELAVSEHSPALLQKMADNLLQTGIGDKPPVVFYHYPCADGKHLQLGNIAVSSNTCQGRMDLSLLAIYLLLLLHAA